MYVALMMFQSFFVNDSHVSEDNAMRWNLFALFSSKNNYIRSIIQTVIACSLFEEVCSLTGRSTLLCEHKGLGKSVDYIIGTYTVYLQ